MTADTKITEVDEMGDEIVDDTVDTIVDAKRKKRKKTGSHYQASLGISFNTKDVMIGGTVGLFLTRNYLSLNYFFYGRFYKKTRFEKIDDHMYYQLKEYRFLTGITLEKYIPLTDSWGLFGAVGGAVTFGDYAGTTYESYSGLTPVVNGGIMLRTSILMKAGYQYWYLPQLPSHHIICEFTKVF